MSKITRHKLRIDSITGHAVMDVTDMTAVRLQPYIRKCYIAETLHTLIFSELQYFIKCETSDHAVNNANR